MVSLSRTLSLWVIPPALSSMFNTITLQTAEGSRHKAAPFCSPDIVCVCVCGCVCVCVWVGVCVCVSGRAMRFKRETHHNVLQYGPSSLLKKTIEPCPKHNRKCNGFNGFNGNCIGFNGNYNGVYWYVMDYIGGMLNLIGKMPKTLYKKEFCNGFTGKS